MAHHIEVQRLQKLIYVDSAGVDRRVFALPREVSYATCSTKEKSAEVIVVMVTSLTWWGGLTINEGLNVKMFQML